MKMNSVLRKWNINKAEEIYLFEYLLEKERSNCFYLDKLPLAVSKENSYKFDQFDHFFQEVSKRKALKKEFFQTENKYKNVLIKLWLYNKVYVEFDKETLLTNKPKPFIDAQYKKYLKQILQNNPENDFLEIVEKEELAFWNQIGIRNVAFPVFHLDEFQLLLTPCWSCYIVYFHDLSRKQIVQEISMSEGLFLRKPL